MFSSKFINNLFFYPLDVNSKIYYNWLLKGRRFFFKNMENGRYFISEMIQRQKNRDWNVKSLEQQQQVEKNHLAGSSGTRRFPDSQNCPNKLSLRPGTGLFRAASRRRKPEHRTRLPTDQIASGVGSRWSARTGISSESDESPGKCSGAHPVDRVGLGRRGPDLVAPRDDGALVVVTAVERRRRLVVVTLAVGAQLVLVVQDLLRAGEDAVV